MQALVSMLRAVNVGGYHKIKMDALRAMYESLGLVDVRTHLQSGNVVFRTRERNLAKLAKRIEDAIEQACDFRPDVILRTPSELRSVIAKSPFCGRDNIEPAKLAVVFLAGDPAPDAAAKIRAIPPVPEEVHINGRELYIYFPNGMARPKLPPGLLEKIVKIPATSRNWNTVTKLLAIVEELESAK